MDQAMPHEAQAAPAPQPGQTPPAPGPVAVQTAGVGAVTPNDEPRYSDHFRAVINTRTFVYTLVIASGAAFIYMAATKGDFIKSMIAVAAVFAVWFVAAAVRARGHAEIAFLREYARQRNLRYIGNMELLETAPLLAAGERHWCEHYIEGPLGADTPNVHFGLAHFTFEEYEESPTRRGNTVEIRTPHNLTICVAEVPEAADMFHGIYVVRRRGVFKSVSGTSWLDFDDLRRIEPESEGFNQRFDLYVRKAQDENNLLRLFKPSFQQWLADLPAELYFEYHQGTLAVYRYKHETEAVQLDAQIHTTARIARELREAAA